MSKPLDTTSLEIECESNGTTKVSVWVKCWTAEDIDDVIQWLKLAKTVMEKWETLRKQEQA